MRALTDSHVTDVQGDDIMPSFTPIFAADGRITNKPPEGWRAVLDQAGGLSREIRRAAGKLLETAAAENRALTDVERDAVDRLTVELDEVHALQAEGAGRMPGQAGAGKRFADLFPTPAQASAWSTPGEFLRTVHAGLNDPRLFAATFDGLTPAEGGFAVPGSILGPWLDLALEDELMRKLCTVVPMPNRTCSYPAWDDTTHAAGAVAGLTPAWTQESATMTAQVGALRLITLNAKKCAIYVQASNELVQDGMDLDVQMARGLSRALSFTLDHAFVTGDGAGKPLGLTNCPAAISVTKASGQVAATFIHDNVVSMFSRLLPGSHKRAVWLANPNVLPQLLQMGIPIGTAGSYVPVFNESSGEYRLLGRPLYLTEHCATLGTVGDVILFDPQTYVIGLRADAVLDKSMHVGFANDLATYRLTIRVDGQCTLASAVTPYAGSTQSGIVLCETRS